MCLPCCSFASRATPSRELYLNERPRTSCLELGRIAFGLFSLRLAFGLLAIIRSREQEIGVLIR